MSIITKVIEEMLVSVLASHIGGGKWLIIIAIGISVGLYVIKKLLHRETRQVEVWDQVPTGGHQIQRSNYNGQRTERVRYREPIKKKASRMGMAFVSAIIIVFLGVGLTTTLLIMTRGEDDGPRKIIEKVNALSNENVELKEEKKHLEELNSKEFYEEITRRREWNRQRTIDVMNAKFRGALKNKGEVLYNLSVEYETNPIFLAAKFCWESGYGTSNLAMNANNPSGINYSSTWGPNGKGYTSYGSKPLVYVKFPNIDVGMEESIILLNNAYISEGRVEVKGIGAKWAPTNDSRNGMHGMDNNAWVSGVSRIYLEMYGQL